MVSQDLSTFSRSLFSVPIALVALTVAGCGGATPAPQEVEPPNNESPSVPTDVPEASLAIVATAQPAAAPQAPIVLGYFTNWAHHRPSPCDFKTADVDPKLFTHINFSFGLVEPSKDKESYSLVPSDKKEDVQRLYGEVNALKKKNPDLKTFIAVGGWAFNEKPTEWIFSAMAETKERRGTFIRQSIEFARQHGFDGIDIDWEFPGAVERGGRPQDTENFTSLLREFRAQMQEEARQSGKDELMLTIASPAGQYFYQHQELGKISQWLNWVNVMTYDYHGSWEMETGALTPLRGDGISIESTISAYKKMGVPANKIVLGMATYVRGWSGVIEGKPGAKATGNMPVGPCGTESLAAYQVEQFLKDGIYEGKWDESTQTPFAFSKEKGVYLTYDNEKSIGLKLDYLKAEALAGAMFWAIDLDDFKNGYPIIGQVSRTLLGEESEQASPPVAGK